MATGVGLRQIALTQLIWSTPETPCLVQESWWYLMHKLSNGKYCVQMTTFGCRGNKGGSNRNLNDSIGFPENPLIGENIMHAQLFSPLHVKFFSHIQNFCIVPAVMLPKSVDLIGWPIYATSEKTIFLRNAKCSNIWIRSFLRNS